MKKFKRVLVANRGEIAIRVFRACNELGIRTVAVYTEEDKASLFRTKADEAYQIGKGKGPVEAYLNIEEIIHVAKTKGVDAIHPGYGFLAENSEFSRQCEEAGITFIGPTHQMIDRLGDKVQSKWVAKEAGVPTIPGGESIIRDEEEALRFAKEAGYPVMIKAAAGGGGRGMRLVESEETLLENFHSARNEAAKAFGDDGIFIEKYLEKPKHIEVQILGDNYGDIVHLYERDCSIQRRYQKVIEYAPAICLSEEQREKICADALRIAQSVNYRSAGTVEFLLDASGQHYFIEMNPRIQVEHTVTEIVTGIDIVQTQLWLAQGYSLDAPEVNLQQEDIRVNGCAIQCRVTTEDPNNHFAPDTGKIEVYRTGSGFGVRLDGGTGFTGAVISPYYDSLLVKVTSFSRSFADAIRKATRSLRETRIEGVKTNIGFLINVLNHPTFQSGQTDTGFISMHSELFNIEPKDDTELKLLRFIGNKVVNEPSDKKHDLDVPVIPQVEVPENLRGAKQILDEEG
ncbi:MAG: ATP-grasp domain-containing protein, partial [Tissierellia bacterium]|nr:ATP-grasp domain-containing protein [Tissierellia bacterium]